MAFRSANYNMRIQISSLYGIVKNIDYIKRNDINLISIRDTSAGTDKNYYDIIDNAGLSNLLVINFDDILEALPPQYKVKPPDEQDIITILNWAKQKMQENNNDFIVQCTAGISRSSAVAILVNYLQDPENALKVINPMLHCPNEKVLELGEKVLNTTGIKEPVKELLKKHDEAFLAHMDKGNELV
jgi:predicted protein tyrosine phosphatase